MFENKLEEGGSAEYAVPASERRGIAGLTGFVIFALTAVLLSTLTPLGKYLSGERIQRLASELGVWGPGVILVAGTVFPLLFLPRAPLAFVSGLLYGVVWGSVLANTASLIGACVQFAMGKGLLAPTAGKLRRKYTPISSQAIREKAFLALLVLRSFPLSNFVATNLVAGALRVRFFTYFCTTFLGMIPSTIMYAAWGACLRTPSSWFYAVAAGTLFLIVAGTWATHKYLLPLWKNRSKSTENEA